jgi:hypothetical protein
MHSCESAQALQRIQAAFMNPTSFHHLASLKKVGINQQTFIEHIDNQLGLSLWTSLHLPTLRFHADFTVSDGEAGNGGGGGVWRNCPSKKDINMCR